MPATTPANPWQIMFRAATVPTAANYIEPPAMAVSDRSIYLLGGIVSTGVPQNELFELKLDTGTWHPRRLLSAVMPHVTSGHTLTWVNGTLQVLGARVGSNDAPDRALQPEVDEQISAELWSLDIDGDNAAWQQSTAPSALARIGHCAVSLERRGMMVIYGGEGPMGLLSDAWQWDAVAALAQQPDGTQATGTWRRLNGGASTGGLRPSPRRGHACAVISSASGPVMVLSGGEGAGGVPLQDLWKFNLADSTWHRLEPPPLSSPSSPEQLPLPPLASCTERAFLMSCKRYREDGTALAPGLWQYSTARGPWERLLLAQAASGSDPRLAPPICPTQLRFGQASAPPACATGSTLWLLGIAPASADDSTAASANRTVVARGHTAAHLQLWQFRVMDLPKETATDTACALSCGAHGHCERLTRRCHCELPWYGPTCAKRTCGSDCAMPRGHCDSDTGACVCTPGYYGARCELRHCPACAGSASCDPHTGCCVCPAGYEGCDCARPTAARWHRQQGPTFEPRLAGAAPSGAQMEVAAAEVSSSGRSPLTTTITGSWPPGSAWSLGAAAAVCGGRPILVGGLWSTTASDTGTPRAALPSARVWEMREATHERHHPKWTERQVIDDRRYGAPSARQAAAAVSLSAERLLIHGGVSGDGRPSEELWMLRCHPTELGDYDAAAWRFLPPEANSMQPEARAFHTVSRLPARVPPPTARAHERVLLYGGAAPARTSDSAAGRTPIDPSAVVFGDVWMLVMPASAPEAEPAANVTAAPNSANGVGALMDITTSPARWERLWRGSSERARHTNNPSEPTAALEPAPRSRHAAITHAHGACCKLDGCLLIFGGLDGRHRPLGDLWEFCVATRTWHGLGVSARGEGGWIPQSARPLAWPMARHQHTLIALVPPNTDEMGMPTTAANALRHLDNGRESGAHSPPPAVVLFGGAAIPSRADASPLVDDGLWLFSLRHRGWVRVHSPEGSSRPEARIGHVALATPASTLWLWGGLIDEARREATGNAGVSSVVRASLTIPGVATGHARSHEDAWSLAMPAALDDALEACFGRRAVAEDEAFEVGGSNDSGSDSSGCHAHGACDLALGRCVCDVPWMGDTCNELAPTQDARQSTSRRPIVILLCFCTALVVGGAIGWLQRDRRLKAAAEQRAKDQAREAKREMRIAKRKEKDHEGLGANDSPNERGGAGNAR